MVQLDTDYDPHLLQKAMGAMSMKRTALENAVLEKRMPYLDQEMQQESEARDINLQQGRQAIEAGKFNLEEIRALSPAKRLKTYLDIADSSIDKLSFSSYAAGGRDFLMKRAAELGIEDQVNAWTPPPEQIAAEAQAAGKPVNEYFEERKLDSKQKIEKIKADAAATTAAKTTATTLKNADYVDPEGKVHIIDKNSPYAQTIIDALKLKPYSKEAAAKSPPAPHTTVETSPDGKQERTVLWDGTKNQYAPMEGAAGQWHAVKSQVINITQANKEKEGFDSWLPEDKEQAFGYNMITGKPPVNAQGMQANDRNKYAKAYAHWLTQKGLKPQDVALMQADYKAGDMSLKNMAKQEAPMSAFVGNINKQIAKVQQLYDNNDRTGIRLIDLPVRELKVRAKGSGDEAVKASYLLEISNEIGKLSSGASASVQQLSDSAKEDWKKVHDPTLSFKEIMKVVNATRDQANMRIQTWREAKEQVRSGLRGLGIQDTPAPSSAGGLPVKYEMNGTKYNIPADKEAEFLKDNPKAKKVQ